MSKTGQEVENEGTEGVEAEVSTGEIVDMEKVALQNRLSELEGRLRTVSAAYKDKQDEIAGVRDRLQRQAKVDEEIRRGEVVATLFEPVENLHRSIQAARGLPDELVAGLRMVHQEFMGSLRKLGLEEVPGVGSTFDPNLHEAIATEPVSDASKDNVVTNVFSAGFRIGKRLVRPARVVIGSYQAEA